MEFNKLWGRELVEKGRSEGSGETASEVFILCRLQDARFQCGPTEGLHDRYSQE